MKAFVLLVALLALGRRAVAQDGEDGDANTDILDTLNDIINEHTPTDEPEPTCAEGEFMDCDYKCIKQEDAGGTGCKVYGLEGSEDCNKLVGDYVCDQGQRILSNGDLGPNLDCQKFNYDNGDCNCGDGRTMTCSGYCLSDDDCASDYWKKDGCEAWLHDNVCDYGQRISDAGITMHFECARFNFDNFACDQNAKCEDFDLNDTSEACPNPDDQTYVAFPTEQPTQQPTKFPTIAPTYGNCKSNEIDEIDNIVTSIERKLDEHIKLMAEFVEGGGGGAKPGCKDDSYAWIELPKWGMNIYCDEVEVGPPYEDCKVPEVAEKCCETCCIQHGFCS